MLRLQQLRRQTTAAAWKVPLAIDRTLQARTPSELPRIDEFEGTLRSALAIADPEAAQLINKQRIQNEKTLNVMASETYSTPAVLEATQASFFSTEGYAGRRPIGGKHWLDEMERLCWRRALETFGIDDQEWAVNVQPLSGALANLETFTALLKPGDCIMGLEMTHGGHLSHGFQTPKRKISEVANKFTSVPYHLKEKTGRIDYEALESAAVTHKPKLIIAGASAYSRLIDKNGKRL